MMIFSKMLEILNQMTMMILVDTNLFQKWLLLILMTSPVLPIATGFTTFEALIQAGAAKCSPRPKYTRVIWTNIDSGANVHISNDPQTMTNAKPTTRGVDRVDGTESPASHLGHWTFWLGNKFVHSKKTFLMPNNPTCNLDSSALKLHHGYVSTIHDQFMFAKYAHANGSSFSFTKENKLLRTINALDYIPIICYLNQLPETNKAICKQVQVCRSTRHRKETTKMKECKNSILRNPVSS